MPVDLDQPSYHALRKIIAEHTKGIVIFSGAGLSAAAKLPSWPVLRNRLVKIGERHLAPRPPVDRKADTKRLELAQDETDLWRAFSNIKEVLGETTYHSEMRDQFPEVAIPEIYKNLWKMSTVEGFISLNIDQLISMAFASVYHGRRMLTDFCGIDLNRHGDVLVSGNLFLCNLHGKKSESKSWVFTVEEREALFRNKAYERFLSSLFTTRTVVFMGITADDVAVEKHLKAAINSGFSGGDHFWITDRSDSVSVRWAESHGIRTILYDNDSGTHAEVHDIVDQLHRAKPAEDLPVPVSPSISKVRGFVIDPPDVLQGKSSEEIRSQLNKQASKILNGRLPNKIEKYTQFWKEYEGAIHRAWYVGLSPPDNEIMGFTVSAFLTKGGFGEIYLGDDGSSKQYALKILHNISRNDPSVIDSFRRGVRAMRILSDREVSGIVPYKAAWEIPPCAVMDFIEGPNLEEAIEAGKISGWAEKILVGLKIAKIIRSAHSLPEGILHRDIRPANIMLSDLWVDESDYEVCMLDFDLAWHKDAPEKSINIKNSMNGFLAPELVGDSKFSTRSALVDSYGMGMTLFYIAAGRVPQFSESKFEGWGTALSKEISSQNFAPWRSIPHRWRRLVYWATRPLQKDRWDIGRIIAALSQMNSAIGGPTSILAAELFAEEILARSNEGARIYEWDPDRLRGGFEIREGFKVTSEADESTKRIKVILEWMNIGDREFSSIRKYIYKGAEDVVAFLNKSKFVEVDKNIQRDMIHISASITVSALRNRVSLDDAVNALNSSVESLKIN